MRVIASTTRWQKRRTRLKAQSAVLVIKHYWKVKYGECHAKARNRIVKETHWWPLKPWVGSFDWQAENHQRERRSSVLNDKSCDWFEQLEVICSFAVAQIWPRSDLDKRLAAKCLYLAWRVPKNSKAILAWSGICQGPWRQIQPWECLVKSLNWKSSQGKVIAASRLRLAKDNQPKQQESQR